MALLLLPTYLASVTSDGAFSAPVACQEAYSEDVYALAAILYSECRGEPREGRMMVAHAVRNRAKYKGISVEMATRSGMKGGRLEPELVEEAAMWLQGEVCHGYRHWLNTKTATDLKWKRYALTRCGVVVGRHFFF